MWKRGSPEHSYHSSLCCPQPFLFVEHEVRALLPDRHADGVEVAARHLRNDGGINDPEALDTDHFQIGGYHGIWVNAHLTCSAGVVAARGVAAHIVYPLIVALH